MVCLTYRDTKFDYICTCIEGCYAKQEVLCTINKINRNTCKYCRYVKCDKYSGMNKKWVSGGDTPVFKRKSITTVTKKTSAQYKSDFHKYDQSTTKKLIDEMLKIDAQTYLNDVEVSQI